MTTKSTKSTKTTKANWIALFGIALLFCGIGIGQIFITNGEWGNSALYALAGAAITGFLLTTLVGVKGQRINLKVWRTIEYIILLGYIAFAVLTIKPISYFFWANDNKAQFMQELNTDIENIKVAYTGYEKFEKDALNATKSGLTSAIRFSKSNFSPALTAKMEKLAITNTQSSVNNFIKIQENVALGTDYYNDRDLVLSQINELQAKMESSSILFFPSNIKKIKLLSDQVGASLKSRSEKANLFVIKYPHGIEKDNQIFEYSSSIQSLNNINSDRVDGFITVHNFAIGTSTGVLIALLIHLMILLNYMVTNRTFDVGFTRRKQSKARGIILNINKK